MAKFKVYSDISLEWIRLSFALPANAQLLQQACLEIIISKKIHKISEGSNQSAELYWPALLESSKLDSSTGRRLLLEALLDSPNELLYY